jgi:hypothetical protein
MGIFWGVYGIRRQFLRHPFPAETNKKPRISAGFRGGLDRNRTSDTRIFNGWLNYVYVILL